MPTSHARRWKKGEVRRADSSCESNVAGDGGPRFALLSARRNGCAILVSCCKFAHMLSKTLAIDSWLVIRDGPRSLVYITEGSGAILHRAAASASAIDEEATRRFLSPGVEYHLTNYLTHVSCPQSGSAPFFGTSSHPGQSASIAKFSKDQLWTKLSARIKGGFSFVSFSPLSVLKSVCRGASTLDFDLLHVLLLHSDIPLYIFVYFH